MSVAEIQQVYLALLRAFEGMLAAAMADKTTVAGTPAFQHVTNGLVFLGPEVKRLMPDGQRAAATPVEAKAPTAGDPLLGIRIKSGT